MLDTGESSIISNFWIPAFAGISPILNQALSLLALRQAQDRLKIVGYGELVEPRLVASSQPPRYHH
ncbi:MAG: hypothetical protein ABFD66_10090 [Smithella sp.]